MRLMSRGHVDEATWSGEATGTVAAGRVADLRAAFGSEAAFRPFYERALPRVYGYLLGRCRGDIPLAEDLTQAAFTEAVRTHRRYDGRSDAVTWLIGIARHKLLDQWRADERQERRQIHLAVRELHMASDDGPWREVDDRDRLAEALAAVPAAQRAVLVLHYVDGIPVRDVARLVGRSESATESLLARGRASVRAAWPEASDD